MMKTSTEAAAMAGRSKVGPSRIGVTPSRLARFDPPRTSSSASSRSPAKPTIRSRTLDKSPPCRHQHRSRNRPGSAAIRAPRAPDRQHTGPRSRSGVVAAAAACAGAANRADSIWSSVGDRPGIEYAVLVSNMGVSLMPAGLPVEAARGKGFDLRRRLICCTAVPRWHPPSRATDSAAASTEVRVLSRTQTPSTRCHCSNRYRLN
jgi:hypothetical protein